MVEIANGHAWRRSSTPPDRYHAANYQLQPIRSLLLPPPSIRQQRCTAEPLNLPTLSFLHAPKRCTPVELPYQARRHASAGLVIVL